MIMYLVSKERPHLHNSVKKSTNFSTFWWLKNCPSFWAW